MLFLDNDVQQHEKWTKAVFKKKRQECRQAARHVRRKAGRMAVTGKKVGREGIAKLIYN